MSAAKKKLAGRDFTKGVAVSSVAGGASLPVRDLRNVIDMDAIRAAGIRLGVDPLGGAGVYYWGAIAERYGLDLTVISEEVDPTFRFMPVDWDGRVRMDPSSSYEVPVGFKWFADGLFDGSLGCGEESAGASFLRLDGTVWTTDKDGIVAGLLSAEMTARAERDPGETYSDLTRGSRASSIARPATTRRSAE